MDDDYFNRQAIETSMKTTDISRILAGGESNQLTFHDVLAFTDATL